MAGTTHRLGDILEGKGVYGVAREFTMLAFAEVLRMKDKLTVIRDEDGFVTITGEDADEVHNHIVTLVFMLSNLFSPDPDDGKASP